MAQSEFQKLTLEMCRVAQSAGITVVATAGILEVDRMAIYFWKNGLREPHHPQFVAPQIQRIITTIQQLVEDGELPLQTGTRLENRRRMANDKLVNAMRKQDESAATSKTSVV